MGVHIFSKNITHKILMSKMALKITRSTLTLIRKIRVDRCIQALSFNLSYNSHSNQKNGLFPSNWYTAKKYF
jgi:hypothetical protein